MHNDCCQENDGKERLPQDAIEREKMWGGGVRGLWDQEAVRRMQLCALGGSRFWGKLTLDAQSLKVFILVCAYRTWRNAAQQGETALRRTQPRISTAAPVVRGFMPTFIGREMKIWHLRLTRTSIQCSLLSIRTLRGRMLNILDSVLKRRGVCLVSKYLSEK